MQSCFSGSLRFQCQKIPPTRFRSGSGSSRANLRALLDSGPTNPRLPRVSNLTDPGDGPDAARSQRTMIATMGPNENPRKSSRNPKRPVFRLFGKQRICWEIARYRFDAFGFFEDFIGRDAGIRTRDPLIRNWPLFLRNSATGAGMCPIPRLELAPSTCRMPRGPEPVAVPQSRFPVTQSPSFDFRCGPINSFRIASEQGTGAQSGGRNTVTRSTGQAVRTSQAIR
jgi:hypothetical protein